MKALEKLSLGVAILELVGIGMGRYVLRKRNREFMQKYYGVNTIDELIKKMEYESYNNKDQ